MKKKSHKRMQMGGMASGKIAHPSMGGPSGASVVKTQQAPITRGAAAADRSASAMNMQQAPITRGAAAADRMGVMGSPMKTMKKGGAVKSKKMRGGGLARKGVGMALAKGGMVRGAGCAKRGVKKAETY
jgi:hypothetical protein